MSDEELGQGLSCFIVGPIGDRLEPPGTSGRMRYENATQMWENVFEPSCATFGMAPIRADKITESGEIPEQIFTLLRDADVVIADLTGGNANVMYELGLRHTRDKVTIQIGEHEQLPFDVTTIRTVKFKRTEAGLIDTRNSLVEALRTALSGQGKPVTATRVWNQVTSLEPDVIQRASALSYEDDDPADGEDEGPGIVDRLAAGETAVHRMTELLEDFSAAMVEMGGLSEEVGEQVTDSTTFNARLTLVKRYADAMKIPASRLDSTSSEYLERVSEADAMVRVILDSTREAEEIEEEVWSYFRTLWALRPTVEEASVQFAGALQAARDLRRTSNQLKNVSKSIVHSFNAMLRGNQIVTDWAALIEDLPDADEHLFVEDEDDDRVDGSAPESD